MKWFKIEVARSEKSPYHFVGASPESLESLAKKLEDGQAIRLDHLLYFDRGKVKTWEEWDKSLIPTVFISPKDVVTIMQFKDDPRHILND